jgi:hypothetical protein
LLLLSPPGRLSTGLGRGGPVLPQRPGPLHEGRWSCSLSHEVVRREIAEARMWTYLFELSPPFSIRAFASARERNHSRLRHSSRNLPLKLLGDEVPSRPSPRCAIEAATRSYRPQWPGARAGQLSRAFYCLGIDDKLELCRRPGCRSIAKRSVLAIGSQGMYVENFSKLGEDFRSGRRAPAVAKEATLDQREHCPRSSRRSLRSSTASFALRPCL